MILEQQSESSSFLQRLAVMGQTVNRDKECERTVTFFRKTCSKYIKRVTI